MDAPYNRRIPTRTHSILNGTEYVLLEADRWLETECGADKADRLTHFDEVFL